MGTATVKCTDLQWHWAVSVLYAAGSWWGRWRSADMFVVLQVVVLPFAVVEGSWVHRIDQ